MAQVNPLTSKLKTQLKMSINRLKLLQQKQTAIAKQQRRDLATLLDSGKEQSAKIRVEIIIHEDINIELLEILELYCELLLARISLLDQKECDPGLEEAVKTIIYCGNRTEVKELHQVREILMLKFGKEFSKDAVDNLDNVVQEKVIKRLSTAPPSPELVNLYLCEVARTYHVAYSGLPLEESDSGTETEGEDGGQKEKAEPVAVAELSDATSATPQKSRQSKKSKEEEELDALRDRFAALRRR